MTNPNPENLTGTNADFSNGDWQETLLAKLEKNAALKPTGYEAGFLAALRGKHDGK